MPLGIAPDTMMFDPYSFKNSTEGFRQYKYQTPTQKLSNWSPVGLYNQPQGVTEFFTKFRATPSLVAKDFGTEKDWTSTQDFNPWNVALQSEVDPVTGKLTREFYENTNKQKTPEETRSRLLALANDPNWKNVPWTAALKAEEEAQSFLQKQKSTEATFEKALKDVEEVQKLSGEKSIRGQTGQKVISAQSLAQKGIAGGTTAGRTLAGPIQSEYEVGSILPASWMRQLNPTEVAQKASGITSPVEGTEEFSSGEKKWRYDRGTKGFTAVDDSSKKLPYYKGTVAWTAGS